MAKLGQSPRSRHVPTSFVVPGPRPLQVFNAGSSTELGRFRVFHHRGRELLGPARWYEADTESRVLSVPHRFVPARARSA